MKHYDLLVIGSGKGGKSLAMKFAKEGQRVALVEQSMVGGSCINVACIPTKTLVKSAKVAALVRRASEYGVSVSSCTIDPKGVMDRKDRADLSSARIGSNPGRS
jgi:pyruvate/2-oxoglutarate dehydrogenase complex dihydrolipoamide dehydrogenase (E3) component